MISLKQVLFPTDFSELSVNALKYARSFAETFNAELHVLHVVDEAALYWTAVAPNSVPVGPSIDELTTIAKTEMEKFAKANLGNLKAGVITKVVTGRPFMEIIRYARDKTIDLVVIGTHGRSGLHHVLLGSVAEKVVRKAPCPVLTIRHPEHEFVMP
jgi:nucleotide-binding universal stress UspA family protein